MWASFYRYRHALSGAYEYQVRFPTEAQYVTFCAPFPTQYNTIMKIHRTTITEAQLAAYTSANRPSAIGRSVLVVDDDLEAAIVLSLMLRRMGHEVLTADNGPDGLDWAEGFSPDVVLLDLGMPSMDGFELCREIRKTDWGASATVVAITGHDDEAHRKRSKEAGFDLHLVKPVDPQTLARIIGAHGSDH